MEARVKNSVKHTGMDRRSAHVRACDVIFQRGFHLKVDRMEALLLVCSSTGR